MSSEVVRLVSSRYRTVKFLDFYPKYRAATVGLVGETRLHADATEDSREYLKVSEIDGRNQLAMAQSRTKRNDEGGQAAAFYDLTFARSDLALFIL